MNNKTSFKIYKDPEEYIYVRCCDLVITIGKLRLVYKEPESITIFNGLEKILLHLTKNHIEKGG